MKKNNLDEEIVGISLPNRDYLCGGCDVVYDVDSLLEELEPTITKRDLIETEGDVLKAYERKFYCPNCDGNLKELSKVYKEEYSKKI